MFVSLGRNRTGIKEDMGRSLNLEGLTCCKKGARFFAKLGNLCDWSENDAFVSTPVPPEQGDGNVTVKGTHK